MTRDEITHLCNELDDIAFRMCMRLCIGMLGSAVIIAASILGGN
jgi:hypothetical protein